MNVHYYKHTSNLGYSVIHVNATNDQFRREGEMIEVFFIKPKEEIPVIAAFADLNEYLEKRKLEPVQKTKWEIFYERSMRFFQQIINLYQ